VSGAIRVLIQGIFLHTLTLVSQNVTFVERGYKQKRFPQLRLTFTYRFCKENQCQSEVSGGLLFIISALQCGQLALFLH